MMLEGARVQFVPYYIPQEKASKKECLEYMVTGRITYINWAHKYFAVQYGDLTECFKFSQLGNEVTIVV